MAQMTGGEAIVKSVMAQGVDTFFALPGAQIDHLFCALYDVRDDINLYISRHEQGAAYMALGYARSTGNPGVYAVVPGPGLLNSAGALSTAFGCNAPVLCLSGQIPSTSIGRGIGELHEIPDQLAMIRGVTKWAERIEHPSLTPGLVSQAFAQLKNGRPRPVELEMSPDIMGLRAEVDAPAAPAESRHPTPDSEKIDEAAALIAKAKKPMIFVGAGAQHCPAEVKELAEMLVAPVAAFRSGRGVLDDRHDLSVNWPTAHRLWAEADVIIAIGTRLDFPRRMWGEDENLKVVRIDIDPLEMQRISPPAVPIVADAREALTALLPAIDKVGPQRLQNAEDIAALKLSIIAGMRDNIPLQMAFVDVIREVLPEDGFFVDELTQVGYTSWTYMPVYNPRSYISSGYQGTLGYGLPTSLGVKAAHPDKMVISISGDGGFMFGVAELATAVGHKLNIISIVFNDGSFGNVKRIQRERYDGKELGSTLTNPDFVKLAESFGAAAWRVETPSQLRKALELAANEDRPSVIEVSVGDLPSQWPYIVMPNVRKSN